MKDIYLIAHNIRSMYNVGSLFRASDGAGVKKIFISGYTACPPREQITKTALGAEDSVPWEKIDDIEELIKELHRQGIMVVSLEKTKQSTDYTKFKPRFPLAVILGNEITGVSEDILKKSDRVVHLPMKGVKESLNVASAAAIILYNLSFVK